MSRMSRRALAAFIAVAALLPGAATAADALKEIRIDWATYNPVSMILKQKGLLEKEFAKDGISIVWVQSAGSNKALEFLSAAEPALEPKSIEPALRNSSALLEPADCTQTTLMPSLANSFSSKPFCLSTIDTGL